MEGSLTPRAIGRLSFLSMQAWRSILNHLQVIRRATNLGDNASLAIHPASTIFHEYTSDEKSSMGVSEGLVRLSVGIETLDDLIDDIDRALETI